MDEVGFAFEGRKTVIPVLRTVCPIPFRLRLWWTGWARSERAFRHPAPEYVRFERPPVTEQIGLQTFGETEVKVRIRYFDYGVASVELLKRFRTGWLELTWLANRWTTSVDLEPWAEDQLRKR